ncbi:MAG: hypothetical protein HN509_04015 [Halobacteriovoraceae bacterium]|nr:hypothetical protein [Halobacteriovoraceae bacterium]
MNNRIKNSTLFFTSLISILLFIEIALQIFSISKQVPQPIVKNNSLRILALGESTTAFGQHDSYPKVLEQLLKEKYPDRFIQVIKKGYPGSNTNLILSELPSVLLKYRPHIVITMLGINDVWGLPGTGSITIPWGLSSFLLKSKLLKLLYLAKVNFQYQNIHPQIIELPQLKLWAPDGKTIAINTHTNIIEGPNTCVDFSKTFTAISNAWESGSFGLSQELIKTHQLNLVATECLIQNIYQKYMESPGAEYRAQFYQLVLAFTKRGGQTPRAYYYLYTFEPDSTKKEKWLNSALLLNMGALDSYAFLEKVGYFINAKKYESAEKLLRRNISHAFRTENSDYLLEYIRILLLLRKEKEAKSNFMQLKKFASGREGWSSFFNYSIKNGKLILSKGYRFTSELLFSNPKSIKNYQSISKVITKAGIIHYPMQYPRVSITPLRAILENIPSTNFVANKVNFEGALTDKNYDTFFSDRFAGNFGHFRLKASKLIAKQIVQVLKENKVFDR